jgi:hypothetical protein
MAPLSLLLPPFSSLPPEMALSARGCSQHRRCVLSRPRSRAAFRRRQHVLAGTEHGGGALPMATRRPWLGPGAVVASRRRRCVLCNTECTRALPTAVARPWRPQVQGLPMLASGVGTSAMGGRATPSVHMCPSGLGTLANQADRRLLEWIPAAIGAESVGSADQGRIRRIDAFLSGSRRRRTRSIPAAGAEDPGGSGVSRALAVLIGPAGPDPGHTGLRLGVFIFLFIYRGGQKGRTPG